MRYLAHLARRRIRAVDDADQRLVNALADRNERPGIRLAAERHARQARGSQPCSPRASKSQGSDPPACRSRAASAPAAPRCCAFARRSRRGTTARNCADRTPSASLIPGSPGRSGGMRADCGVCCCGAIHRSPRGTASIRCCPTVTGSTAPLEATPSMITPGGIARSMRKPDDPGPWCGNRHSRPSAPCAAGSAVRSGRANASCGRTASI